MSNWSYSYSTSNPQKPEGAQPYSAGFKYDTYTTTIKTNSDWLAKSQETTILPTYVNPVENQYSNDPYAAENETLFQQKEELAAKCALLSIEGDRLNSLLQDRDQEIIELKQIIDSLRMKHRGEEKAKKAAVVVQEDGRLDEYERKIAILMQEKQAANTTIYTYEQRIEELMKQMTRLNSELNGKRDLELIKIREYEANSQTLQQRLNRALQEKERLEIDIRRLQEYLNESENSKNRVFEYERKITDLTQENLNLKRQFEEFNRQKAEELKRLKVEIEKTIRIQFYKEEDFKTRGYGLDKNRADYESTIKSLKEKCNELERRVHLLTTENERLKAFLSDKDKEIEALRTNEAYKREIEELRRRLTEVQESFDVERRDYLRRLQDAEGRVLLLTTEITRITNIISLKDGEIEQWRRKYLTLESDTQGYVSKMMMDIEIQFKDRLEREKEAYYNSVMSERQHVEKQITTHSVMMRDNEAEVLRLIDVNERLTSQVEEMSAEIKALKARIELLMKERENQMHEIRIRYEEERRIMIEKEIKILEARFTERIQLLEEQNKVYKARIQDFEVRQIMLFIEIERLYAINSEFIDELNRLSEELQRLTQENNILQRRISELTQTITIIQEDKIRLEAAVTELTIQNEEYERRIQILLNENARLSDLSLERLREIDNLKNSFSAKINISESDYGTDSMRRSQIELKEMSSRYETQRSNLEAQINQLKHTIETNRGEIARLQEINQQRKTENDNLHAEIHRLKESSVTIAKLQAELKFKTQQYEQSLKEVEESKRTRDFLKQQLEQLSYQVRDSVTERVTKTLPQSSPLVTTPNESPVRYGLEQSLKSSGYSGLNTGLVTSTTTYTVNQNSGFNPNKIN